MEGTSQLNNGNKTLNTLNMVGNAARNNTASAPQQQNEQENSARLAAELFPILAPMDMDNNYLNFSQDTGVLPAEVNSHATSLATRIAGITASHRPNSTQERVTMDERTTTIEERMRTEALPSPTPTPSIRSRQRLAPEDWVRLCNNWIPSDELETWEQEMEENRSQRTQTSPPPTRQSTMTPVPRPQAHTNNQRRIVTELRDLSLIPVHCPQPRQGTVYQDHGLGQNQGFNRGPPPPPPSPPPQQRHFMHKQQQADVQEQHHQAHHQPQHPFNKEFHRQPQFKQGFQGEFQGHQPPQAHQPPHHHHPYAREAGAWRGSRKNWRNNSDPITQTMEIGEWSMGAESFEAGCRG
ncbi:hypothetical protein H4Q26_002308 [Puccinia striiformis f. sp. tritici PST-130]|nr:hypothetical protein H4Q26_002308 [Puccinia striiformis f. sp. tritici PST-130]